ncbi:MAG: AbrB/MazE/SpoVT family DNA-binding domain-containing protein [Sphingomicrobium sp.]|nr:AbrB/MazE/SpoVT family DNA-binding domain-containing protein [Sphingomonadales bacterium]
MNQNVKKWGNSLAVRIPASVSAALGLKEDDQVELRSEDGKLIIERVQDGEITLERLLAKVTPENIHAEFDWGPAVGKEIW